MFKRILLAVDGSGHSDKAVDMTIDLAQKFDSDVLVYHVREKVHTRGGTYDMYVEESHATAADDAARRLKDLGIKANFEEAAALTGHVADRIVNAAARHDADLIVMGSRGLSTVSGLLLGSITHKVVHLVECPVLIAH